MEKHTHCIVITLFFRKVLVAASSFRYFNEFFFLSLLFENLFAVKTTKTIR